MIAVRKSKERGHTSLGWLEARHTFSFGDYQDAGHTGFRALRALNEDRIAGGGEVGMHPHKDVEIVTYILCGAVQHRDNLGHLSVMKTGEVQLITAGRGIEHSEANYSPTEPARLLQVWIEPEARRLDPDCEQKSFVDIPDSPFVLAVSRSGREGSMRINQDVDIVLCKLNGNAAQYPLRPGRGLWLQVTDGALQANGVTLNEGDGAAITEEVLLSLAPMGAAHSLLFDLA